jgi:putative phage-type endonuclease
MVDADPISLTPGSPEWLRELTASKVAAVLGLSPWESRFSLWYRMSGALFPEPQTPQQERGLYLENAVVAWLADQYRLTVVPGLCWRNHARSWQVASPDGLVVPGDVKMWPPLHATAVVEVKTAAKFEEWGPYGSDEIPAHYRAQAVWHLEIVCVSCW